MSIQPKASVFILPMRNGNLKAFIIFSLSSSGFYITYEEWKLCPSSFESWFNKFLYYLWGMETSFHAQSSPFCRLVFILPMRNGNPLLRFFLSTPVMFLYYLWGMETSVCPIRYRALSKFLYYLWGMETRWLELLTLAVIWFLYYLWGMETIYHKNIFYHNIVFLYYLWGMEIETYWPRRENCRASFYITYEEWKLFPVDKLYTGVLIVFILPMRNRNEKHLLELKKFEHETFKPLNMT